MRYVKKSTFYCQYNLGDWSGILLNLFCVQMTYLFYLFPSTISFFLKTYSVHVSMKWLVKGVVKRND